MGDQSTPRDPKLYKNRQSLAEYLGFVDTKEFTDWLNDISLFKDAYNELLDCWIIHEEEVAKAADVKRGPGPALDRVERRLVEGELFARQTYSRVRPDKAAWLAEDHYARFLWRVRSENNSMHGIFHGKNLSVSEMDYRVWQVLQRCVSTRSPSRQTQSSSNAPDPGSVVSPMSTAKAPLFRLSKPRPPPSVQNTAMAHSAEPITIADETTHDLEASSSPGDIFSQKTMNAMAEAFEKSKQPGHLGNVLDLRLKSRFDPMDLDDDDEASNLPMSQKTMDEIDETRKYHWTRIMDLTDAFGRPDIIKDVANAYDSIEAKNAESFSWRGEVTLDSAMVEFNPLTEATIRSSKDMERWFDNQAYQREDHVAACKLLGIRNPNMLRMPGMSKAKTLKWFQPVVCSHLISFLCLLSEF